MANGNETNACVGLEFADDSIQLSISSDVGCVDVDLVQLGFVSDQVLSARAEDTATGEKQLRFRNALERIADDAPAPFGEIKERPTVRLKSIFAGALKAVQGFDRSSASLAVVTPPRALDSERTRILKVAASAGWPHATVVNRTTAVATDVLAAAEAGSYLVLVVGHSATEAAVVQRTAQEFKTLAFEEEPHLCADHLDGVIMTELLKAAGPPDDLGASLGGPRVFSWLKQRAAGVRNYLNHYDAVKVEVPEGILGEGELSVTFTQDDVDGVVGRWGEMLDRLVDGVLKDAEVDASEIRRVVVGGHLAHHRSFLQLLRRGKFADRLGSRYWRCAGPGAQSH